MMGEGGFDAVTAAAELGHTPQVLLDTYAHADRSRARELAAGLD